MTHILHILEYSWHSKYCPEEIAVYFRHFLRCHPILHTKKKHLENLFKYPYNVFILLKPLMLWIWKFYWVSLYFWLKKTYVPMCFFIVYVCVHIYCSFTGYYKITMYSSVLVNYVVDLFVTSSKLALPMNRKKKIYPSTMKIQWQEDFIE